MDNTPEKNIKDMLEEITVENPEPEEVEEPTDGPEISEDDFEDEDILTNLEDDLPPVKRKNLYDKLNIPIKWLDIIIIGAIAAIVLIIIFGALRGNGII